MMALLDIGWPFLGMMLLTFTVWVALYRTRIGYMRANRIHPQSVATPDKLPEKLPEHVNNVAYNYNHLFELPVLFYALALYLLTTGRADAWDAALGWGFLAARCAHSWEQCRRNLVMRRFVLFAVSSLFVWVLLFRTLVREIAF